MWGGRCVGAHPSRSLTAEPVVRQWAVGDSVPQGPASDQGAVGKLDGSTQGLAHLSLVDRPARPGCSGILPSPQEADNDLLTGCWSGLVPADVPPCTVAASPEGAGNHLQEAPEGAVELGRSLQVRHVAGTLDHQEGRVGDALVQ
jgi:hypothetical protein